MGNINEIPLSEMFKSEKYIEIISSMARHDYNNFPQSCKNCYNMILNDFALDIDYLQVRKFDCCADKLSKLANNKSVLLFAREKEMEQLIFFPVCQPKN